MADTADIPAWIALFIGLYSLAAAVGEFRMPGTWAAMVEDLAQRPGLRFLTGVFVLSLGAAIYLVTPWRPGDWLAVAVSVVGGVCVVEGLLLLAAGDRFMDFARRLMGQGSNAWAGFAALLGAAALFTALSRLQAL